MLHPGIEPGSPDYKTGILTVGNEWSYLHKIAHLHGMGFEPMGIVSPEELKSTALTNSAIRAILLDST